jgi:hypothetical protein
MRMFTALNGRMDVELKGIWLKAVMNSFKVLFQHLPGGSEKNHEHSIAGTSRM